MRHAMLFVALAGAFMPLAAKAHITVRPRQSDLGARQAYTVRAPNEKKVDTVRVEGAFPPEVRVITLDQVPGWTVEAKRDAAGAIVGAIWTGDLPPAQVAEFGLVVTNPQAGTVLTWTFTQVFADGSKVEWAGPQGSRTPAPQVELRPAQSSGR